MKYSISKIENVSFITINNDDGMMVVLSSFGASIYDIEIKKKNQDYKSMVLTPKKLDDFYYNDAYYGKSIGRFSGRIDDGKCIIDNVTYNLEKNWNGINSLHGTSKGISFINFDNKVIEDKDKIKVIFTCREMENDLPGNMDYKITYTIAKDTKTINIHFEATTDKKTLCNMTNHTYFNLSGNGKDTILDHRLYLNCDKYTKVNENLITTSIEKVDKIMDFRKAHKIKKYIFDKSLQDHIAKGYDHCFIKDNDDDDDVIAKLSYNKITLEVKTNYNNIVVYTCNYPKEFYFNIPKLKIVKHHAICLECQNIPNGINMDTTEKSLLDKNEKFDKYIEYNFIIKGE